MLRDVESRSFGNNPRHARGKFTSVTFGSTFDFGFEPNSTCIALAGLAPGASCTLNVVSNDPNTGRQTGNLVVDTSSGNFTAAVIVESTPEPSPTLTPASHDFGNVPSGTNSAPFTFTLTNTSALALPLSGVELVGDPTLAGGFEFQINSTCLNLSSLAAGASCTVVVVLTEASTGTQNAYITAYTGSGKLNATVSATGTAPPPPTLTPASHDFGNVPSGTNSAVFTFTLTNPSALELPFNYFEFGGNGSTGFTNLPNSTCSNLSSLAAGASCTVNTLVVGANPGTQTDTLTFYTGNGNVTATLSVTGTAPQPPPATLSPANLDFGEVVNGATSGIQTFTVTNNSVTVPFNIVQSVIISTLNDPSSQFTLLTSPALSSCYSQPMIAPGASCTFAFEFSPTSTGGSFEEVSLALPTTTIFSTLTGTSSPAGTYTPSIQFGKGFTADALMMSGPANVVDGALQLTSGPSSAASSAFYPTEVPTASFNTNFTFQLLDPTAEGITFTFTIQGDAPNAVGSGGGGLGYQGIPKSIAIKLDLKDTAGEGTDSTGVYVNGAAPTVPAISLVSSGIDLHSGHIFNLALTYDGTTMTINLVDTVTGAVWATQIAEHIPAIVGSNVAYFGFTAGSGTPALSSDAAALRRTTERPAISTALSAQPSATSNILTWTYVTGKNTGTAQTINFPPLAGTEYGAPPMKLVATASSGLPVSYAVTGPAKLSGSTLTVTGAGTIKVTATQSGNATFAPAAPVTITFNVAKALLTVTAKSVSRIYGAANPTLAYSLTGFVNGDTTSAVSGTANLSTTAAMASPAGHYPITFATDALAAVNYEFTYVPGTLTVLPAGAGCKVIDYSKGLTSTGLTLNGSAKVANGILKLTDGGHEEAGSAFFSTPLPITSFVTDFTFQLLDPEADGITFTIQAAGPHALGQAGGGLGYAGIPDSVALKFDLYNNAGEGTNSIGIYNNGGYPSVPSASLTGTGLDLHSGHIFEVHIQYDGTKTILTLTDTATKVARTVSVPGVKAGGSGIDSAYFGFTGGTGYKTATQEILAWTYQGGSGCPVNP